MTLEHEEIKFGIFNTWHNIVYYYLVSTAQSENKRKSNKRGHPLEKFYKNSDY